MVDARTRRRRAESGLSSLLCVCVCVCVCVCCGFVFLFEFEFEFAMPSCLASICKDDDALGSDTPTPTLGGDEGAEETS